MVFTLGGLSDRTRKAIGRLRVQVASEQHTPNVSNPSLAEWSRSAYTAGRDFADVLSEAGHHAVRYDARLHSRPLCFLHMPKTGGASMIHALDSMFDRAEICPAYNIAEFDRINPEEMTDYKIFRGHLLGRQLAALPPDTELFTVLRSPATFARSMYEHVRRLDPNSWYEAWINVPGRPEGDAFEEARFKESYAEIIGLCVNHDLLDVLDHKSLCGLMLFHDVNVRLLAPTQLISFRELSSPQAYAAAKRRQFPTVATQVEKLLAGALVVGDHDRLDIALQTLCERRGWPAPPALPRIHAFGTGPEDPERERVVAARMSAANPYDDALYGFARDRARGDEERLLAAAGNRAAIHGYVNARFSDRFFREARPVLSFDLSADRAWAGYGWSLRKLDETGTASRAIDGGSATLLARLETGTEYVLIGDVIRASNGKTVLNLTATMNGCPLVREQTHWFSTGHAQIIWSVPAAAVAAARGHATFGFHLPAGQQGETIEFNRLACQPQWIGPVPPVKRNADSGRTPTSRSGVDRPSHRFGASAENDVLP